jgi:Retroviral aspartyl protease
VKGTHKEGYWTVPDPAIPIIRRLKIALSDRSWERSVPAIVDTGADRSMLPMTMVAEVMDKVQTQVFQLTGATGPVEDVTGIELSWKIEGIPRREPIFFLVWGTEPLIGRDILNQFVAIFDGAANQNRQPTLVLTLSS